jgi:HAD superfamily hydrolase (TIGR01549 family)
MNISLQKYQALIFDCDGVVLNSNKIKTQAFYESVKHFGKYPAEKLVDYHVQNGGVSRYVKFEYFITRILNRQLDRLLLENLLFKFSKEVMKGLMNCEVAEGLYELRKKTNNTKWLIVSGGDQDELRDVFSKRGLINLFNGGVYGSPDTKEIILSRELNILNINKNSLFLGDSKYDYEAATKANLDFVFVTQWTEVINWQDWCESEKINVIGSLSEL